MVSWIMEMLCGMVKNHRVIMRLVYHGKTFNWCRISFAPKTGNTRQDFAAKGVSIWTGDVGGCLPISL